LDLLSVDRRRDGHCIALLVNDGDVRSSSAQSRPLSSFIASIIFFRESAFVTLNKHTIKKRLLTSRDSLNSLTDGLGIRLRTQILRQLRSKEDLSMFGSSNGETNLLQIGLHGISEERLMSKGKLQRFNQSMVEEGQTGGIMEMFHLIVVT
jgi:hypothetical protein